MTGDNVKSSSDNRLKPLGVTSTHFPPFYIPELKRINPLLGNNFGIKLDMFCRGRDNSFAIANSGLTEEQHLKQTRNRSNLRKANLFFFFRI